MKKNITIIQNKLKDPDKKYTLMMEEYFKSRGCVIKFGELDSTTDLAVVIGGDGSILRAARDAAHFGVPILGINLGRVGYMAEVEINELDEIDKWFTGDFRTESRMMLDIDIFRNGECRNKLTALNDAVFKGGTVSRMIEISLICNGMTAGHYYADGLIVATPTGSTAYSLSAGGPVIDPLIDCFCVTPVSAHSLGARPMVFSSDSVLEISDSHAAENELYLTVDGSDNILLLPEDTVRITKANIVTKLVRIKNNNFYTTFVEKMSESKL